MDQERQGGQSLLPILHYSSPRLLAPPSPWQVRPYIRKLLHITAEHSATLASLDHKPQWLKETQPHPCLAHYSLPHGEHGDSDGQVQWLVHILQKLWVEGSLGDDRCQPGGQRQQLCGSGMGEAQAMEASLFSSLTLWRPGPPYYRYCHHPPASSALSGSPPCRYQAIP